jgi:hypothetical protein
VASPQSFGSGRDERTVTDRHLKVRVCLFERLADEFGHGQRRARAPGEFSRDVQADGAIACLCEEELAPVGPNERCQDVLEHALDLGSLLLHRSQIYHGS